MTRYQVIEALLKRSTIALTCEPEHESIEGNCSAIDEDTDRETAAWIRAQLNSGNEWAWCCAHVRATYRGFSGDDYLGACSYESEDAFRVPGGYFDDMCWQACAELADQLISAGEVLASLS